MKVEELVRASRGGDPSAPAHNLSALQHDEGAIAPRRPFISAIIPACNAKDHIGHCLAALLGGERTPDEIIVVDDGSTDGTADIARAYGVRVESVHGRRGAAYPRNVGVAASRGDLLLFIDADVVVHRDTVKRFEERFHQDSGLTALMGSYDESPSCPELLSQYRNLMHCYIHQRAARIASTFWTGCGAVRREAFQAVGGFDEQYQAMEDVDLGRRLFRAGYRIELDAGIQCQHRKRWTFRNMVFTDVFMRGIPWTLLILREGSGMPNELNLKWTQRLCVLGMAVLALLATYAVVMHGGYFLTPLLGTILLVTGSFWTSRSVQPQGAQAQWTLAFFLTTYVALSLSIEHAIGPAVVVFSYLLLFARRLYLQEHRTAQKLLGVLYGCLTVGALVHLIYIMPGQYDVYLFWLLGIGIVLLNLPFYLFLCRRLGHLYGLATVPFHLMFHFYGGIAFGLGAWRYWTERRGADRRAPAA